VKTGCHPVAIAQVVESSPTIGDSADPGPVTDTGGTFHMSSYNTPGEQGSFAEEQRRDPEAREIIKYVERGRLPEDVHRASWLISEGSIFAMVDDFVDPKHENRT